MRATWEQARSWRIGRHFLDAPAGSVDDVVRRLTTIPAWSGNPELAVALRLDAPDTGLAEAVASRRLLKTYTFGGSTQLATHEHAAVALALRAAGRQWELPSWQRHYGLAPGDWPPLREAVREALMGGPRTQAELADAVTTRARFRHLHDAFTDASHTFLKPFAWQGDLSIGPARGGKITLQGLHDDPRWPGIPDLDIAGPTAITAYLAAYGPTTPARVHAWLGEGLSAGRKRIDGWLHDVGDRLARFEIEGESVVCDALHASAIEAIEPTDAVHLVPGHDQWVRGPGTADTTIVPAKHRALATRGAGLILLGGRVSGTWKHTGTAMRLTWLADGAPPRAALEAQAQRVDALSGGAGATVSID